MKGILADVNVLGQLRVLLRILEGPEWREVWRGFNLTLHTFADFDLPNSTSDSVVWQVCQQREVLLITGNRNKAGPDSLEATIEKSNTPRSLPVFTIGDTEEILRSPEYANRAAVRLLEYLIDIDNYRGTGRLWLP
jgi:hypothetical protein